MNEKITEFVTSLNYEMLPDEVVKTLKYSFIDSIACAIYGSKMPWSKMLLGVVEETGHKGKCIFPTFPKSGLPSDKASLLLGSYCHAFEQDNLRFPGAGVHAGATIMSPALAIAQERKLSGKELLVSAAAGLEVLSRLGKATMHSLETRGFHAPGVIGPVGSAVACSKAMNASPNQISNSIGIAASMSGGLLAFSKSEGGGMIKRLHLGRAAEAGVTAAQLACRGFESPETAIVGQFGLLDAFCPQYDLSELNRELGSRWETLSTCFKTFPIHITAHGPLLAALGLRKKYDFKTSDIDKITIKGTKKMVSHHVIYEPADIMQAQYSTPFCIASGLVTDLSDPNNFNEELLTNHVIRELVKKIDIGEHTIKPAHSWHANLAIKLFDGRKLESKVTNFKGMPTNPLTEHDLVQKFLLLTKNLENREKLLDSLLELETVDEIGMLPLH